MPSPIISANLAFNVESLREFMEFFPFEKRFFLTRYLLSLVKTWARAMTGEERKRVVRDFCSAAVRAHKAGFDMVELHGANGYLLCQYLSKFTNKLASGFGGDFPSRAAFPLTVIRAIKERLPKDFPLGYRLILREWVPQGVDPDQAGAFARYLEKESMAYISVSVASYNSLFSPEVLKKMAARAYLKEETAALKRTIGLPVIISGRITTPGLAETLLREGAADLVGLGRPLRADPGWIKKAGIPGSKIIPCINCNHCLKQVVLEQGFTCTQWSRWRKMRTRFEHRLLARSLKSLWVISGSRDLEVVRSWLPFLIPRGKDDPATTLLFITEPGPWPGFEGAKRNFLPWLESRAGFSHLSGKIEIRSFSAPPETWEKRVLDEISRGEYGRIFLGAFPDQFWRQRLLYRVRGKITGLLNARSPDCRVLVPVDLSDTTFLALRLFCRPLMALSSHALKFVHVQTGKRKSGQTHTWEEVKKISGIDPKTPLTRIRTKEDVVSALMSMIETQGYTSVVMGKRGISGIKRWLLGSVSAGVLGRLTGQSLFLID